ncbi:hypothetical protein [Microviridae sp.]|nr:hypothetical protein [Microviridae sp.]
MAKSRSRTRSEGLRETPAFANRRLTALTYTIRPANLLQAIEDRREFHPERAARPARSFSRSVHTLAAPAGRPGRVPVGVTFENPTKVLVCVRRKSRREVLFAMGRTGRGSARGRRRRSEYSDIQC